MRLLLNELVVSLGYHDADLAVAAARRLHVSPARVRLEKIVRRALDARPKRPRPVYVVNAVFAVTGEVAIARVPKTSIYEEPPAPAIVAGAARWPAAAPRPVVVGCGPAGLAAACALARAGARPLLLERGQPIARRRPAVGDFWGRGKLDPENNVLYGEGGAGAFSDGKLTSRGKDVAGRDAVLAMLVAAGAPPEILHDAQAHLGSDVLARVIPAWRQAIVALGGEVRFGARVDGLRRRDGRLTALTVSRDDGRGGRATEEIPCAACVLATGHGADDVYRMLARDGVALAPKGYALGVRVELPQAQVNAAQYGHFPRRFRDHPALGPASFFLTDGGRCHTFCMCPGGRVIACAAAPGTVGTNGMSLSARGGPYANAAFLVPCPAPEGQGNDGLAADALLAPALLAERGAFLAGGGDYTLPATTLAAFPGAAPALPERSCARARPADFSAFLPAPVVAALKECVPTMLARLGDFDPERVVVYGPETRSTALVRVPRGDDGASVTLPGLWPAGEGAGYAGGIVSSAVDGLRQAEKLLAVFA